MIDMNSIQQVLGCLMRKPNLLGQVDRYKLTVTDFPNRFTRYIFNAIVGLYEHGAQRIAPNNIVNFLEFDEVAKKTFNDQNGIEYLQDAIDFSELDKFDYYYDKIKKFNLLRDLRKNGISIDEFYCENLLDDNANKINAQFEQLTTQDICETLKSKLLHLESDYVLNDEVKTFDPSADIEDFIEHLNDTIDIGPSVQGHIYNQIIGGAEKGALTIRSAGSGLGKALPNSTLIPTPEGWRRVEDIRVGDALFDKNGQPTKVLGVYPQGEKDVYQITFRDGRTAKCCDEHLWSYYDANCHKLYTSTTKELMSMPLTINGLYNILVPMQGAAKYSYKHFSIEPYQIGATVARNCAFSNNYEPILKEYLIGNIDQRLELFNGIIDNLGYPCAVNGSITIYLTNKALSNEILELCHSLGFCASTLYAEKDIYLFVDCIKSIKESLFSIPSKREKLQKIIDNNDSNNMYLNYNPIVNIHKLDYSEQMTCFYVQNSMHLFLTENYVVTHNTRAAVGDACYLAYPIRYNSAKLNWETAGSTQKILFIITEQSEDEIKKMMLAYLSDIDQSRFKLGSFNNNEKYRLAKAAELMRFYHDNFKIVKMPNPTIESLRTKVREECSLAHYDVVFFDYIFINPALLKEFNGFSLRNDELLLMMASALKDLARELDVAIFTSTQVNAQADDNKNIRNEASLSGGRSTINKADNGIIMARVSVEEEEVLERLGLTEKYGMPNIVSDVFKVRNGAWTQVRIWSKFDLGRMKRQDLFITDSKFEPIQGFIDQSIDYEVHDWDDAEYQAVKAYAAQLNSTKEQ